MATAFIQASFTSQLVTSERLHLPPFPASLYSITKAGVPFLGSSSAVRPAQSCPRWVGRNGQVSVSTQVLIFDDPET